MPAIAGAHDIVLNGISYVTELDEDENRNFRRFYGKSFKDTVDNSTENGEHTLDRWKSYKRTDWSKGEDQKWADNDLADPSKFYDSLGVDVSTPGVLTLLKDVEASKDDALTAYANLPLLVADGKLWLAANDDVYYFDGSSWTAVVMQGGKVGKALAYDGDLLYVATVADKIWKSNSAKDTFTTWGDVDAIKDMIYHPGINQIHGITATGFYRFNSSGVTQFSKVFGTGWDLVGIDTYQGNHVIFGGGFDGQYYLFEYDQSGVSVVAQLPPGFVLTGLKSLEPNTVLLMGYKVGTAASSGVGALYTFSNGALSWKGKIGTDTANKTYGAYVAARNENEVMIGWNYQSGLYRYSMEHGGISKNVNITSINDKVVGVAWFKGKWYYSIGGNGVYTTAATYPAAGGYLKSSMSSFKIAEKKNLKEGIIESQVMEAAITTDESFTASDTNNGGLGAVGDNTLDYRAQMYTAGNSEPIVAV